MSIENELPREAFDINLEAHMHGEGLGLPQAAGESDSDYRRRIAGVLRGEGRIIEAHEVLSGRRYDDPEQGELGPMAGILGAFAQIYSGREYSPLDPARQVEDDVMVGFMVGRGQDEAERSIAGIMDTFGPGLGIEILDTFRRHRD